MDELIPIPGDELREQRRERYRRAGIFSVAPRNGSAAGN